MTPELAALITAAMQIILALVLTGAAAVNLDSWLRALVDAGEINERLESDDGK